VARVSNLLEKNEITSEFSVPDLSAIDSGFIEKIDSYKFNEALAWLWDKLRASDESLSSSTPWKMTDKNEIALILKPIVQDILNVAYCLQIFMPQTADKIIKQFTEVQIKKGESLFPRLEKEIKE